MNLGPHLILITCSFSSRPLIHFTCQYQTPPVIRNSWIMPNIPHTPSYTCHSSHNHTQPKQIIQEQQTCKYSTVSPSISLRLRGLAQARRACSGEPSPRLGESTKARAWATRDLAKVERVAWATFRAKKPRQAPCFISPRRDGLAWAKLTGLATVLHCNNHVNRTKPAYQAFSYTKSKD